MWHPAHTCTAGMPASTDLSAEEWQYMQGIWRVPACNAWEKPAIGCSGAFLPNGPTAEAAIRPEPASASTPATPKIAHLAFDIAHLTVRNTVSRRYADTTTHKAARAIGVRGRGGRPA